MRIPLKKCPANLYIVGDEAKGLTEPVGSVRLAYKYRIRKELR